MYMNLSVFIFLGLCFIAVIYKLVKLIRRKSQLKPEQIPTGSKAWRVLKSFLKTFFWIIATLGAILFVEGWSEVFYPAGFYTKSVERANAFLFHNDTDAELPDKVEFIIDGSRAVFHQNTKPYNELMTLLRDGRSDERRTEAGDPPPFGFNVRKTCGEMKITSYGIPSHFRIIRSDVNTNYYWIRLPKLTSPGTTYPFFTYDSRVIDYIRSHKAADH